MNRNIIEKKKNFKTELGFFFLLLFLELEKKEEKKSSIDKISIC
jgi:hypothetical protein